MYRRHFNPYTHNYDFRNIQTGEGLLSNIKAFGRSALPSGIRKKATDAAFDTYKQQASQRSKAATNKAVGKAFSKIRQTRPKRDGKKTILKKLRKKYKNPKRESDLDKLSKNFSLKLLLDDDD